MTAISTTLAATAGTGPDLPVAAQVLLALFFAYAVISAVARYVGRSAE
ncbi:hypothetical protein ACIO3O_07545 [Streptomyces sp. NPDC087440]